MHFQSKLAGVPYWHTENRVDYSKSETIKCWRTQWRLKWNLFLLVESTKFIHNGSIHWNQKYSILFFIVIILIATRCRISTISHKKIQKQVLIGAWYIEDYDKYIIQYEFISTFIRFWNFYLARYYVEAEKLKELKVASTWIAWNSFCRVSKFPLWMSFSKLWAWIVL